MIDDEKKEISRTAKRRMKGNEKLSQKQKL
jgi:hypothetical protein